MKKIISVLVVLCLAMTIFAAGSVRVGGAFNFMTGKSAEFAADAKNPLLAKEKVAYKTNGFGFDVAGDFDVANNLSVWADFNMVFGADAKYKIGDGSEMSIKDGYDNYKKAVDETIKAGGTGDVTKAINIISVSAGAAYKFDMNPLEVKLGGGLFFERGLSFLKAEWKNGDLAQKLAFQYKTSNFGIAFYGDVKYKFNANWGLGLTVMPHVGLINTTSAKQEHGTSKVEDSKTGFRLSFSMPIVLGVSYSF